MQFQALRLAVKEEKYIVVSTSERVKYFDSVEELFSWMERETEIGDWYEIK